MDNRLEISRSSPAASRIPKGGLPKSHPLSQSLNRLRENPRPGENDLVVEHHMPPVTLYVFNDGAYSIGYSLLATSPTRASTSFPSIPLKTSREIALTPEDSPQRAQGGEKGC